MSQEIRHVGREFHYGKCRFIVLGRDPCGSKLIVTQIQANPEAAAEYPLVSGVII